MTDAVDASAVARVLGVKTAFKNLRGGVSLLPQRIAIIGQGSTASTYPTTKAQFSNAFEVATLYGFGSPLHLAMKQLFPVNGDGAGTIPVTLYPMVNDGSSVIATGNIIPVVAGTEAASYIVRINNIDSAAFVITPGDSVATVVTAMTAAINAELDVPLIAADGTTQVTLTSKWNGTSANDIFVEVIGLSTIGNTFGITQPTGGLINPDVDPSLLLMGDQWDTMVLNCLETGDTTNLDKFSVFGEGRWGPLTRKPLVVFTGTNEANVATAITIPDARKTQRVNSQLVSPGANDLPLVIAARELARIAKLANNDPAHDYGSQAATGLVPGDDSVQWTYPQRDQAVKGGSSTIEVRDGIVNISDVVTFYHPSGDPTPAYRYVVDVVKLQNVIYNTNLRFAVPEWDGAPLIPDGQVAALNPGAKRPRMAVAEIAAMIDGLAANAIISDPDAAKKTVVAAIDANNPKRLNITYTIQLSGNTNIISIDLNFGFLFGGQIAA
jgi:phage tail sheath gpL-like